jgi:hypothetical protein
LAGADLVAVVQVGLVDPPGVEEGAVLAAQVGDAGARRVGFDEEVDARHALVALDGELHPGRAAADDAGGVAGELVGLPGVRPGDQVEREERGTLLEGQGAEDGLGPVAQPGEALADLGRGEGPALLAAKVGLQGDDLAEQPQPRAGREFGKERLDRGGRSGAQAGVEALAQGVDLLDQVEGQRRGRRGELGHGGLAAAGFPAIVPHGRWRGQTRRSKTLAERRRG